MSFLLRNELSYLPLYCLRKLVFNMEKKNINDKTRLGEAEYEQITSYTTFNK